MPTQGAFTFYVDKNLGFFDPSLPTCRQTQTFGGPLLLSIQTFSLPPPSKSAYWQSFNSENMCKFQQIIEIFLYSLAYILRRKADSILLCVQYYHFQEENQTGRVPKFKVFNLTQNLFCLRRLCQKPLPPSLQTCVDIWLTPPSLPFVYVECERPPFNLMLPEIYLYPA